MGKKRKESKKKGKKERKAKVTSKKWEKYEVSGDGLKRKRYCPRCGPGVFLAQHKDRYTCGACGYVEVKEKPKE